MSGHVQKQPAPKRSPWEPEKSKRETGTLERHSTRELNEPLQKKKQKPKTAPAGGGANPPKPPKKGPTGGDNKGPNKDYKRDKDDNKSMGGLTKGSRKEETKNPRNSFKKGK